MESEIARMIRKYDLDVFRIDYNMSTEEDGNQVREGFVENSFWRHVENLYAMFDHLRQQFPGVIFQNCAGGGGRLDWGIMHRFDNTELSDWMRVPRAVKILNGMTWVLPPEILLRTFGTEVPDLADDGDIDSQMRRSADVVADLSWDFAHRLRNSIPSCGTKFAPEWTSTRANFGRSCGTVLSTITRR